jgi:HEAT repeat protein
MRSPSRPWLLGSLRLSLVAISVCGASRAAAFDVPRGSGAAALTVVADPAAGALRAQGCVSAPCAISSGSLTITVPDGFREGLAKATFAATPVGAGKQVAMVTVQPPEGGERWVAVVVADNRGGSSDSGESGPSAAQARVLFADVAAPFADRRAREPRMFSPGSGAASSQLLLGARSESVHLCGRPTLLSPKVLDPADWTFKGVKVQQLGEGERKGATVLTLARRSAEAIRPFAPLLSAVGASSALSLGPLAATDDNPQTAWSEGRGGDGHGELLVTRVSPDLTLTELVVTPLPATTSATATTAEPAGPTKPGAKSAARSATASASPGATLVAPKHAFLVSDGPVFRLDFPSGLLPGEALSVRLPEPLKTGCLALVLDEGASRDKSAAVTIAELGMASSFDDAHATTEALVGALAGGRAEARAAAAVLSAAGERVVPELIARYASLDDAGRVLALGVLDGAPCEATAATYVRALGSKYEAESAHAAARLGRCGRKAAPGLLKIVENIHDSARFRAAEELSVLAPDLLLPVLARRTGEESRGVHRALTNALGRAARSARSAPVLAELLGDTSLPPTRTFELLRVSGPLLGSSSGLPPEDSAKLGDAAEQALARVAPETADFESRYRAVVPAGILAVSGREKSLARLVKALADSDLRVRVEAVRAVGALPSQRAKVLDLVHDPEPRVRQALATALHVLDDDASRRALVDLLGDRWTFVRMASVDSLAKVTADPAVDAALVGALDREIVPVAQQSLIEAVATRRLFAAGRRLLTLSTSDRVGMDLRTRALVGLGRVCFGPSTPTLVELANRGLAPFAERDDATLGHAAAAALARLPASGSTPTEAKARAALSPEARSAVQEVVAVLDAADRCGADGSPAPGAATKTASREAAAMGRTW